MQHTFIWTEERHEELKRLYKLGLSSSQICKEMGASSRNAIIGKIHRLGLHKEGRLILPPRANKPITIKALKPQRQSKIFKPRVPPKPQLVETNEVIELFTPTINHIGFFELTKINCHFPIGDPQNHDFSFCGNKAMQKSHYCKFHHALTHEKVRNAVQKQVTYRKNSGSLPPAIDKFATGVHQTKRGQGVLADNHNSVESRRVDQKECA